ncbi:PucR family transcriptional regulator [Streptomyces sp. NPDC001820]|uniref:PucR family transcriptional regulator n=1 Tax=Streptomyces sp. NPDC001820 TaxID=3364613 RepID=UPI0036C9CC1B
MSADSSVVLRAVATRVLDQLPGLSSEIVRMIVVQEPTYQAGGAVPLELLTQSVAANVRMVLESLAGVERPEDEELSVARTTGRRRAQQGVPLEAVLRAYRLATELVLSAMLAEVRGRPYEELAAFLEVTSAVMKEMDHHSEGVVDGYRRAEAELQRRDAQRQQATFDALLEGRGADSDLADEALTTLGLPPRGPYAIVVATFDIAAQHTLSATRDACAAYSYTAAWRIRGDREIGMVALGNSTVPRLMSALRRNPVGRIGVSDPFDALHEIPEAFRSAEIAVQTIARGSTEVAWIAERLPEALVISSPALAARLAERALGPLFDLPDDERDMLLRTLAVWYDSGRSAARSAQRLYCHRNTILNRLRRIENLSGWSLEDHRFLLASYLGLLTLTLLPGSQPVARPAPVNGAGPARS